MFEAVSRRGPLGPYLSLLRPLGVRISPIIRILDKIKVQQDTVEVRQEGLSWFCGQKFDQANCFSTHFYSDRYIPFIIGNARYLRGSAANATALSGFTFRGAELGENKHLASNEFNCDVLAAWVFRAICEQNHRISKLPSMFVSDMLDYSKVVMRKLEQDFSVAAEDGSLSVEQATEILARALRGSADELLEQIATPNLYEIMFCSLSAYNTGVVESFSKRFTGIEEICRECFLMFGLRGSAPGGGETSRS
jgi:hypothetical protein